MIPRGLVLSLGCCACTAGAPASVPEPAVSTRSAPPFAEPAASVTATQPPLLALDCGSVPPPVRVESLPMAEIIAPGEGETIPLPRASSQLVQLRLPSVPESKRVLVSLDHHPARSAQAELALGSLHTEWDAISPGTHRLVVVWLDERGLPLQTASGEPWLLVRTFHVEHAKPLPLSAWLLLAPAGTLNGVAEDGQALGHPHGFSLLRLTGGAARLTLHVTTPRSVESHGVGPGHCTLVGWESGDYGFELVSETGERTTRTVSVNLDLGAP